MSFTKKVVGDVSVFCLLQSLLGSLAVKSCSTRLTVKNGFACLRDCSAANGCRGIQAYTGTGGDD